MDAEEVVINTGYQNISKERATGSFSVIDNKALNQQISTNILQRIDGMAPGILFDTKQQGPQKKQNFTIRGLSTINGPVDPLIVVDNFIYEGDIGNINPNDVESVVILKDAAATSIYGARGGNGVLVITMKKGRFNQPLRLEVNSSLTFTSKLDLYSLPAISSEDYITVEQTLFNAGYYDEYILNDWYYHHPFTPAVQTFIDREMGLISAQDSLKRIDLLKQTDSRSEFQKYFLRSGFNQQYAINLRGGSDKHAYLFGVGYDKNLGVRHDVYNRLNLRVQNIFRPIKNFQLEIGAYYTHSTDKSGRGANYNIVGKPIPYLKFTNADGSPASLPVSLSDIYTDTAGAGKLLDWKYYPLEDWKHDKQTSKQEDIMANISVGYRFLKYFQIDARYQYQRQNRTTERHLGMGSFYTRDMINRFTQLNYNTGIVKYIIPMGGILERSTASVNSQSMRTQLNFNKRWSKHELTAIAGAEVREIINNSGSYSIYGYNEDPLTTAPVDFVNQYPDFVTGQYGITEGIPGRPMITTRNNRFISTYANAAYTYSQRYIFSISGRRDGSNVFGATTNDKWKPLWSTGLAWDVSKENFQYLGWFSDFKVRLTYGHSGNVDLLRSAMPIASYGTDPNTNLPYGSINTLNNPSLRWEKVTTINIGLDFSLNMGRLSSSIDYYVKKGTDLYGGVKYDLTTWGRLPFLERNVANMRGNGWDVVINSINIDKNIKWSSNLLLSYNRNKTTKYFTEDASQVDLLIGAGTTITPIVGKPLYSIAAYKWGGLDNNGNPQGYLNGQLSTDYAAIFTEIRNKGAEGGMLYVGSAIPVYFGSLINTISWKGFSISANLAYKFGYYFRRQSLSYSQLVQFGKGHDEFGRRWQKPGDEMHTNVPSFTYPANPSRDGFYNNAEINILKGDHIRMQYVNIAYLFPSNKKILKELQVYANAANLGIIWCSNKVIVDS
ncbi:MAG: SusC/RagA family TonB-linked outer membrane protein, partial [Terrimonas sp.]|nr:SusC/RagA family TonB-linked outer membrane protein [Terrimonas sp.]